MLLCDVCCCVLLSALLWRVCWFVVCGLLCTSVVGCGLGGVVAMFELRRRLFVC